MSKNNIKPVITVEISNRQSICELNEKGIEKIVKTILEEEKVLCQNIIISLSFVTNDEIKSINNQYLSKNYATDVISFPFKDNIKNNEHPEVLGEVIISIEQASLNKATFGLSLDSEIILYIIHGILHLLDYNDTNKKDKKVMQNRENELLKQLEGIRIIN